MSKCFSRLYRLKWKCFWRGSGKPAFKQSACKMWHVVEKLVKISPTTFAKKLYESLFPQSFSCLHFTMWQPTFTCHTFSFFHEGHPLTPCHGSAGTGFRNLRLSIGGLANGIPWKMCTSWPSTNVEEPRIGPLLVCTTSLSIIPCTRHTFIQNHRMQNFIIFPAASSLEILVCFANFLSLFLSPISRVFGCRKSFWIA